MSHIYFGTQGEGILAYSLESSTVSTVVDNSIDVEAIVHDPSNNKIYHCQYYPGQIYRANVDESGIESLESNVNWES